jgi:hypothetical protein
MSITAIDFVSRILIGLALLILTLRLVRAERLLKTISNIDPQKLQAAMTAHAEQPIEAKSPMFRSLSGAIAQGVADTLKEATK